MSVPINALEIFLKDRKNVRACHFKEWKRKQRAHYMKTIHESTQIFQVETKAHLVFHEMRCLGFQSLIIDAARLLKSILFCLFICFKMLRLIMLCKSEKSKRLVHTDSSTVRKHAQPKDRLNHF